MEKNYEQNYMKCFKLFLNEVFEFLKNNHYLPEEAQGIIKGFMKAGRTVGITIQSLEETIHEVTKSIFGKKMGFNEAIKKIQKKSYSSKCTLTQRNDIITSKKLSKSLMQKVLLF